MKPTIRYDGNEQGTYTLFQDDEPVAEILTSEDGAIEITRMLQQDISTHMENSGNTLTIKNDDEKHGIIIDIYEGDDCFYTACIWFDDFIE